MAMRASPRMDGFHPLRARPLKSARARVIGVSPKPGQKRKLASDVLKLIFLKELGLISRGRVFITSPEMYTWCQQAGSWLNAARRQYGIDVILKTHSNKVLRKKSETRF